MPERDAAEGHLQHPPLLRLHQWTGPAQQGVHQLRFHLTGDHRQLLEGRLGSRAEPAHPGEHRVRDGRRDVGLRRCQRLRDEEGIARGGREERRPVDRAARAEAFHRRRGQSVHRQTVHGRAGERAQHPHQRVAALDLIVAVGEDHQSAQPVEPPRQEAQHVQRCVVGPVHVLDHEDGGRALGQLPRDCRVDRVPVPGAQRHGKRAGAVGGSVAERAEGPRCAQVVAGTDQESGVPLHLVQEGTDEAGLADAGFAVDERSRPVTKTCRAHRGKQLGTLALPLQQERLRALTRHARILPADLGPRPTPRDRWHRQPRIRHMGDGHRCPCTGGGLRVSSRR